jgi:hypothetical protein
MPVEELDLRAHMLRDQLQNIRVAPDDKSINQLREGAMIQVFQEIADEARMRALAEDIHAVGKTPEDAIRALAAAKGWGKVVKIDELAGVDPKYAWGRTFLAEGTIDPMGGTGFQAAGLLAPGGVVLSWWR